MKYQGLAKASPMVAFPFLRQQNAAIAHGGKKMRCSSLQANSREYHPLPLTWQVGVFILSIADVLNHSAEGRWSLSPVFASAKMLPLFGSKVNALSCGKAAAWANTIP